MTETVLIAGIGNIFLGDDAFGVEVARSLAQRRLPEGVVVKDFGIRGFDLAFALLDPWHTVILVDALPRSQPAGTLSVMEPDLSGLGDPASAGVALNPHGLDPVQVLHLAASLGVISPQILIVGCEPHDFGDELEGRMGLSEPVAAVIEEAATMVEHLAQRVLAAGNPQPEPLHAMER